MRQITKSDSCMGLFFMRVTIGLLFLYGGVGKLFGILGGPGIANFSGMVWGSTFLAYFVGIVELVAGIMLILGIMSRYAAIPLIAILLVAIVHIHIPNDPNIMGTLIRLALIGSLLGTTFMGSGGIALKPDTNLKK